MSDIKIHWSTLKFLTALGRNNNRDWFNDHKSDYQEAYQNMANFVEALIAELNKHDLIENTSGKKCLYRIYNDTRFHKEKPPYNPRFAFSLQRATRLRRGGYYMNIKPGGSFLACGFFGPNPDDLRRIRTDIDYHYIHWNRLLRSKNIKTCFGEIQGERVATVPRGFDRDHPAIDLIRLKQFTFRHNFKDLEIIAPDFIMKANKNFRAIRPWFDYMSEVLTTNADGEPVV